MTVHGVVGESLRRASPGRASAAAVPENAIPFWCLMFFTFVLFLAPQNIVPSMQSLHLGKLSAGLAAGAYVVHRLVKRRALTVATPEVRLVLWFTLVAVISIPLSRSPSVSLAFFLGTLLKSVVVFFLIGNLVDTIDRLKLFVASIALYGFVYSVTALYNFVTGNTMVTRGEPERIWGYPAPETLNPVNLALVLVVILSLTAGLYFATRRRSAKVLLLACLVLAVGGITLTFSRGGFLALSVALVALLVRWIRVQGPLALLSASVLAVVVVVACLLLAPPGYGNRLYSLFDWNRDRVGSIQGRWRQVPVTTAFILDNPLLGTGLGMDSAAYSELGLGEGFETHSIFLQVGTDLGLPGLIVYVLLFVQMLRGLRQTRRRLKPIPEAGEFVGIAFGLELAVWTYLVAASFMPVPYDFTFFYLVGLTMAVRVIGARLAAGAAPGR